MKVRLRSNNVLLVHICDILEHVKPSFFFLIQTKTSLVMLPSLSIRIINSNEYSIIRNNINQCMKIINVEIYKIKSLLKKEIINCIKLCIKCLNP